MLRLIKLKYLIAAILVYLFFLVYHLPASVVFSQLQLPRNIVIKDISGSIWSGQASSVAIRVNGITLDVGSLGWNLNVFSLLLGKVSADIKVNKESEYLSTNLAYHLSGLINLEETEFSINLETLQPLTYGMPFTYSGLIRGKLQNVFFKKNEVMAMTGRVTLNGIKLVSPQQQHFGDYLVELDAGENDDTRANFKDAGGPVEVTGLLKVQKDSSYSVSARLFAREKQLENVLGFLGSRDGSGRVNFQYNGRLFR